MRVLRLHIKLCPTIGELNKHASYLGYKLSRDTVYHLFQLRESAKLGKSFYETPHTKVFLNKKTRVLVLCSGACILRLLLENFHVISLRVYADRIVAVVAVENNRTEESLNTLRNSLLLVEEVNPAEIELTRTDIETLMSLRSLGLLDYPKRIKLEDLARLMSRSKSTISYRLRRAIKKVIEAAV